MIDYPLLGVDEGASEREIKRAYAVRVKQTRPDSDPEGYQRLRETYDAALALARARERELDVEVDDASSAAANIEHAEDPAVAILTQPPDQTAPVADATPSQRSLSTVDAAGYESHVDASVDLRALVDALLLSAADGPDAFSKWLNERSEFLSIESKQRLLHPLVHHLARTASPLPTHALPILLGFFRVDALALRDVALARDVQALEARAVANAKALRKQELRRSEREGFFGRAVWRELSQPLHPGRRLAIGLLPGFKGPMRRLLDELEQGQRPFDSAPDPRKVAYWERALDPHRVGLWRFLSKIVMVAIVVAVVRVFAGAEPAAGVAGVGTVGVVTWVLLAFNDARKRR